MLREKNCRRFHYSNVESELESDDNERGNKIGFGIPDGIRKNMIICDCRQTCE